MAGAPAREENGSRREREKKEGQRWRVEGEGEVELCEKLLSLVYMYVCSELGFLGWRDVPYLSRRLGYNACLG